MIFFIKAVQWIDVNKIKYTTKIKKVIVFKPSRKTETMCYFYVIFRCTISAK